VVLANKVDEKTSKFIKADAYLPFKEEIFDVCLKGSEIPYVPKAEVMVNAILGKADRSYSKKRGVMKRRLNEIWEEIGWKMLDILEEEFKVEFVQVKPIEGDPIFKRCAKCGELAMATRVKDSLCLRCAGSYYAVVGRGIVKFEKEVV